ncbi:MAG: hypothetical protein WCX97_03155 [Candidatus Magasanikbacteria bacterium]
MTLVKPKNNQNHTKKILILAVLTALISQILFPTIVKANLADISQNGIENSDLSELTISKTAYGHLIYADNEYPQPDKVVNSVITAYTSTVDQCDDDPFIAAWGDRVYDGMIAANWLPRGTKIKIPSLFGDKIFTVADRMNARYGYGRLDIWMDATKSEARKFGVKRVDVEIYYPDNEFAKKNTIKKEVAMK